MYMKTIYFCLLTVFLISCSTTPQPKTEAAQKPASGNRAPASFDDELKAIGTAIAEYYGDRATDFKYLLSSNPIVYIGNGAMRILKPITKIDIPQIREYEVMHRIHFLLDGKTMDCYGLVQEFRGQPGVYKVDVGVCNKGLSEFAEWTTEFSRFVKL